MRCVRVRARKMDFVCAISRSDKQRRINFDLEPRTCVWLCTFHKLMCALGFASPKMKKKKKRKKKKNHDLVCSIVTVENEMQLNVQCSTIYFQVIMAHFWMPIQRYCAVVVRCIDFIVITIWTMLGIVPTTM